MTCENLPWDLEERAEDTLVAYLKTKVPGVTMIVPYLTIDQAQYPLITVQSQESDNKNESSPFTGKRQFGLAVAMYVEAINENGQDGDTQRYMTAREFFRSLKSTLVGVLAGNDLHDELNNIGTAGIAFSQAYLTSQSRRTTDSEIVLDLVIDVIAQPQEI